MANLKISDLIQRAPDGTEFLEVIIPPFTPGTNRRVLLSDLLPSANAAGTDNYTASLASAFTSYISGRNVQIVFANPNTGAVTIDLNGLGPKAITKNGSTPLAAGDITAGQALFLYYDGTQFQIQGGGGGGSVTSVTGTTNRITSSGGATPVIDIDAAYDAAITAQIAAAVIGAKSFKVEVTDEVTNIGAGTAKRTFRMPYAMTLTAVRCELLIAQASGSIFTVDINESGTTILSTKLTIDNTETTSVTATTAAVISDTALADDAVITIDVDQIGDGSAIGLKITLIGS